LVLLVVLTQPNLAMYIAIMLPWFLLLETPLSTMIPVVIPFFAFSVGSNFQLSDLVYFSLSGIIITIFVLVSGVLIFYLIRLFSVDHATSGIALGSTASTSLFIR
jgi:hypothetical protein